jgi:hypothetical protein
MELTVRFPMPQIATVVLLVHMGLGCCWHHAHTVAAGCRASPALVAGACACGDHGQESENFPEHDGGRDPHDHSCSGSRCTYVRHEHAPEQHGDFGSVLSRFDVTCSVQDLRGSSGHAVRLADPFGDHVGSPPRMHLLFGVLLI